MATDSVDVLEKSVADSLRIRPIGYDDLTRVYDIENRSMPFGWSKHIFRTCLVGPYECWKLERECRGQLEIVGYYVLYVVGSYGELCNICVDVDEQQAGYGSALLAHAIARCSENGIETVALEVRASNKVAKKLYSKFGFVKVGCRKNYYIAVIGREDAEMMELQIS